MIVPPDFERKANARKLVQSLSDDQAMMLWLALNWDMAELEGFVPDDDRALRVELIDDLTGDVVP